MPASSLASTKASSSTELNPSEASSCPTTSSTLSASMNTLVRFSNSAWRRSDSSCSVRMSMSQPVSCEARRTFWPRRPIASDNCWSGTTTSMRSRSSSSTTLATSAGASALTTKVAMSCDHGMMSIFSPCNSFTTPPTTTPPLQFVYRGLTARPAHADAGANRIERGIPRDHGDLGARARIAGHRLHLDDAVIDFRHLLGEQLGHELRMRPRQENLRAARLAPHVIDIGADAVAVAQGLARQHLVAADDRLAAAEVDHHVAVFDPLDDAVDDVADAVLVFDELPVALGLAHLLHDDLLGGLRGDAAVFQRRQRVGDGVADLCGRISLL